MKRSQAQFRRFFESTKILRWSVMVLLLSFIAVPFSTSYFSDNEISTDDQFQATEWTPATPELLGRNVPSQSATQGELPVDAACVSGGTILTNENSGSVVWTPVSSTIAGKNVRYVRENIRPDLSVITVPSTGSYASNFTTPWGSFGAGSGEYQTRVKAFVDMNGDTNLDAGDFESAWSDYCSITYDPDAPVLPGAPGWATNTPAASYQGDSTGMSNYVACGGTITDSSQQFYGVWGEASDALSGFDHYERQVVYNGSLVYNGSSTQNYAGPFTPGGVGPNGGDGQYYVRVRAIDTLGNATIDDGTWADTSSYASWCGLTIDTTDPTSSLTVTNSPTRDVNQRVSNGGFESDLTGWTTLGEVAVVTGAENGVTPYDSKMVRIGTNSSNPLTDGQSIDVNILSQEIPHESQGLGLQTVGFWYNFGTFEDGLGYDNPGFMVFVGDKMVHQVWSDDVQTDFDNSTLETTGWRYLSINLADVSDPTLTLAFYAGNTDDLSNQSFVYVDNVTSESAVVNAAGQFEISGFDNLSLNQVQYRYEIGGSPVTGSGASPLSFGLTAQPDNGELEYWATDSAGNEETHHVVQVAYDNDAPDPITDLSVTDEADGLFTLDWTAVSDVNPFGVDQAAVYDIRYSTAPILDTISDGDWLALPRPTILNSNGLPGDGLRTPLVSGQTELYEVHVADGVATYYFAVRAADRANNWSSLDLGSISDAGLPTGSTSDVLPGQVVFNEIMWMGAEGDASDEWLELRNMSDRDIDLTGWVIRNLGDGVTPDVTIPSGTLPANGFYLIAQYDELGSQFMVDPDWVTDIELDDAGEALQLETPTAVVIDQTDAAAWAAGTSGAEFRSMERVNQPGDGTDPMSWHNCESASCAEARELYWDVVGNNYGTPQDSNLSFSKRQIRSRLVFGQIDIDHFEFTVTGVQQFTKASYTMTYLHEVDGSPVAEAITGDIEFPKNTRQVKSPELYTGTCSTLGESCVTHAPVSDLKLEVILTGPDVPDRVLTAELQP